MDDVVIVSAMRTPVGRLAGNLSEVPAVDLGACAIRAALERGNVPFDAVDHVIMGQVIMAGSGQIPARQAALKAGLANDVIALNVNKVCASGLKAVNLAAQMIKAGDAEVVVAGGMESMSRAPYLLDRARFGYRMGNGTLFDSMLRDALECPVGCVPMHEYGSDVSAEFGISREEQDLWAVESQHRWAQAMERGRLQEEIIPVTVPQRKGAPLQVAVDEQPRSDTTFEVLQRLKPLKPGGTVTAGNAPGVNDGAAALVVMSGRAAHELGIKPLVIFVAQGEGNDDIPYLHTVPAHAIRQALKKAQLEVRQIGLFEINEAFAAVTLQTMKMLDISPDVVNVNGGAVAIGHPVGASGARILGTLIHQMVRTNTEYGVAGICSGMAQGEATIVRLAG